MMMGEEEEEDRISWLPDLLLVEIISRIKVKLKDYQDKEEDKQEERLMTTKEVIKTTSTISKRWQHLWTLLPNLRFIYFYDGDYYDDLTRRVGNTLTHCPTHINLNRFKLDINCSIQHTSQVNTWIRYAITRNVQELDLRLWDSKYHHGLKEFNYYDDLFFNNSCVTRIKLFNCVFNPPNATICWDQLKLLYLEKARLVGDSIGIILSGSPCLETLELDNCYGVSRIDASASNKFKKLVLTNYGMRYRCGHYDMGGDYIDTIEINAPSMLSLTIQKKLCLENLLLLNVSSLVKAHFNYNGSRNFADSLGRHRDDMEDELLCGLLSSLGHVKDITLGDYSCQSALSRLREKGFQFPTDDTSCVRADERITQLMVGTVAAAAETQTEEIAEEIEENDDLTTFAEFLMSF